MYRELIVMSMLELVTKFIKMIQICCLEKQTFVFETPPQNILSVA